MRSETIPSSRITPDLQIHSFFSSVHSLIFYRVQVREHLTRDQRPFLHPESLQIFRFTASSLQFTSLIFYRVQVREHLTRDQRPFLHPESLQIFRFTASSLQFTSLIFYRVQVREHLTRDQRPFLHPESLQIFRFTASPLQFTSLIFYRVQVREHLTRDQRPFLHPESLQIRFTASPLQFTSLIFYRVQVREHLTRDQRPFLHPESLQIFRFTASSLQFTSLIFYRVQVREHLTRDQRPFLHPESLQILQIHSFFSSVHSLIFYRVQVREHLTRDQRPFLHPESLQIFRFTASPLQFTHSSSTGFRSENTWHEIRDHSFIQNHSRSSDSQLLLFSSPHSSSTGFRSENTWQEIRDHSFIQNHSRSSDSQLLLFSSLTHLLQGSDQITPDKRSETIPSSRITPDLQIHSFFSSVHLTHLLQGSGQRTPDKRSETIPSSRITPDLQIHSFFSSVHSLNFLQSSDQRTPTRDQRPFLLQNHSRSSDSQLLPLSSPHYLLQGSDQRTPDTRSETIPSSRITPDLQIHSFSSSVHSLLFYRVHVREHLTRDQRPFLHSRISPDLQITAFFSSVHLTHLLQGSGQENTWHEIREPIPSSRITPDQIHSFSLQFTSLIFYRVQVREHLTRDQRPFLHPESLQIFRFTASLQFTSLIFYRVQVREHLTRDQRPFLHPESLQIFRFTASSLQFLTHLLQGSGQRTPDTRSETIPSSRITPDLQIHSFSLQFTHSSSTGFRSENTWHEIRDHSFIQNHSRSSDSQLLSSVHLTHLLQGSGQRTPDTRSETIPSSRITPDLQIHSFSLQFTHSSSTGFSQKHLTRDQRPFLHPESLQIFRFTASSLQFTSLIFYRVQVREHLTRDQRPFLHPESLQIFRFTASSLQFLTHLLQGSGQRTPDTRSETIPSSRITPDLQIHSFSLQFTHSSSTGFIREHLTRDQRPFLHPESLQIFRFTASLFSSLTHLLQGSGQRTPDTRSETIPSSRITPDLQIHSFSLQFTHSSSTGFRSENTWHEIRDHSFIQNHSRSSDSQLLSSVHSLIFYRVQVREHLTRDQRPFLHPESLQIFRFTASSLQFTHSSSTGFRSENTWHEIRDHSFIQNHSRSSDSQLLLFSSSLIFYRVQVREHLTRSETIPSSRITPDLQIHSFFSSVHSSSTGFRSENTWHEIRDHSFIQNHSRSSDSQLSSSVHSLIFYRVQVREHLTRDQRPFLHPESLQIFRFTASLFSSLTHLLQGSVREHLTRDQRPFLHPESLQIFRFTASSLQFTSSSTGFRSENTWQRSETIPSSRITPDLQIHSFFSSVHLTHLLQGSGQRTGMAIAEVLCSVTHFCVVFEVCVWIIVRLEDPNMAHYKISNRAVSFDFYLLVFDRIHDAMCLNKMSRTSSRNIGPQHKNTAVYFIVHMGYFLSLCAPNTSWAFAAKKLIFSFIWP